MTAGRGKAIRSGRRSVLALPAPPSPELDSPRVVDLTIGMNHGGWRLASVVLHVLACTVVSILPDVRWIRILVFVALWGIAMSIDAVRYIACGRVLQRLEVMPLGYRAILVRDLWKPMAIEAPAIGLMICLPSAFVSLFAMVLFTVSMATQQSIDADLTWQLERSVRNHELAESGAARDRYDACN